jgi:hypothetical protein
MEKEFIPYEQALALKELGFDEHCWCYFMNGIFNPSLILSDYEYLNQMPQKHIEFVLAPLYQQAFRWFREKYKLDGKPEYFLNDWYCFIINDMKEEDTSRRLFTEFPSYEKAELECLKKLIEIVKNK